jgi:hypothetical protein
VKLVKEEPIGGAIGDGWRRVPGGHWGGSRRARGQGIARAMGGTAARGERNRAGGERSPL